jgi:hypothetical protein
MSSGTKTGSLTTMVNCAGISASQTLNPTGSNAPPIGITAPAGLVGTILSAAGGTLSLTDSATSPQITVGGESSFYLAVFWLTNSGATLNACFDFQYTTVTGSGTITVTCAGASSAPTSAKYWASSGALPTSLPANGTPIIVAVAQDVTDGVSIPGASGANIQQLIATSQQPGLIEWLTAAAGTQERLSAILSANAFDTWPTNSAQSGSLPSGGAVNNNAAANGTWATTGNWATSGTVTDVRFYNLGCSIASFYASGASSSSSAAVMQAGCLLA